MLHEPTWLVASRRRVARALLRATSHSARFDFLGRSRDTPHPGVEGATGFYARNWFGPRTTGMPVDLVVFFDLADWAPGAPGSAYFDPRSPWYNGFLGGYGVRVRDASRPPWGFAADGAPLDDEMLAVVRCDYDVLTAGALGCPPDRRTTRVLRAEGVTRGAWRHLRAEFVIPSALHRLRDARRPDPLYYVAFGLPDERLVDAERGESYPPVAMEGEMLYRRIDARTTFAFGAMFPQTDDGVALRARVMRRMLAQFDALA